MSAGGKIDLIDLSTARAPKGAVMVSDGVRWKPGTAGSSVTVSPTAPSSPATGDLWYDTDATC